MPNGATAIALNLVREPEDMTTARGVVAVASLAECRGLRVVLRVVSGVAHLIKCTPHLFEFTTIHHTCSCVLSLSPPLYAELIFVQKVKPRTECLIVGTFRQERKIVAIGLHKPQQLSSDQVKWFLRFLFAHNDPAPAASLVFIFQCGAQRDLALGLEVASEGLQLGTMMDDFVLIGQLAAFAFSWMASASTEGHNETIQLFSTESITPRYLADGEHCQLGTIGRVLDCVGITAREGACDGVGTHVIVVCLCVILGDAKKKVKMKK